MQFFQSLRTLAIVLAIAVVVYACGGGSDDASSSPSLLENAAMPVPGVGIEPNIFNDPVKSPLTSPTVSDFRPSQTLKEIYSIEFIKPVAGSAHAHYALVTQLNAGERIGMFISTDVKLTVEGVYLVSQSGRVISALDYSINKYLSDNNTTVYEALFQTPLIEFDVYLSGSINGAEVQGKH